MLRNLFALVGVGVVGVKVAEWYVRFQELEAENAELRRHKCTQGEPR